MCEREGTSTFAEWVRSLPSISAGTGVALYKRENMFRRRKRAKRGPRLAPRDSDLVRKLQEILEPIGYRVTAFAAPGPAVESVRTGVDRARQTVGDVAALREKAIGHAIADLMTRHLWLGMGSLLFLGVLLSIRKRRGRYVRDVMVPDVETIESSATAVEAAQRMRDMNVGVLPIVEDGRVRGVVTDRDLVIRGLALGVEASSMPVRECATRQAVTVRPDWSVDRALSLMAEHQVGRLPVTDEEGHVIGMVTLGSLARRSRQQEQVLDTGKEVSERSTRAS
jgi:CBS domain-containing protein